MRENQAPSCDAANLEAMVEAVAYQGAMLRLVVRALGLPRLLSGRVLDFGAGRGDYAAAIRLQTAAQVVCLEPDGALHQHYAPDIPVVPSLEYVEQASISAAYSLNVFEHIPDDAAALRALVARCRAGARIFILVPANPNLWTPMDTRVAHQRRYMPGGLRELVVSAGLTVLEQGWFDRSGYFATRAYQVLHRAVFLNPQRAGAVSKLQMRVFDVLFRAMEPLLGRLPFGKNCWILAQVPVRD
jgi:SAM-dependent methyltransferase